MPPPFAIVGTSAVARALGTALHRAGTPVSAVAGRDLQRAADTASAIGPDVQSRRIPELAGLGAHILIATADARISEVAHELASAGFARGVALHTSGVRGPEALAPLAAAGVSCGTFHPLQTVPPPPVTVSFAGVAFAITGDLAAVEWATMLGATLGAGVISPRADRMSAYHAGAVLAANGLAALLDASLILMAHAGLDRNAARQALGPLMRTALDNALALGPERAVTGPVVRGDVATVEAHLQALRACRDLPLDLYRAVSLHLIELAQRRGLATESLAALTATLHAPESTREHDV